MVDQSQPRSWDDTLKFPHLATGSATGTRDRMMKPAIATRAAHRRGGVPAMKPLLRESLAAHLGDPDRAAQMTMPRCRVCGASVDPRRLLSVKVAARAAEYDEGRPCGVLRVSPCGLIRVIGLTRAPRGVPLSRKRPIKECQGAHPIGATGAAIRSSPHAAGESYGLDTRQVLDVDAWTPAGPGVERAYRPHDVPPCWRVERQTVKICAPDAAVRRASLHRPQECHGVSLLRQWAFVVCGQGALGGAGVRPWRRITSPIAARSGGPPAVAARTLPTSRK